MIQVVMLKLNDDSRVLDVKLSKNIDGDLGIKKDRDYGDYIDIYTRLRNFETPFVQVASDSLDHGWSRVTFEREINPDLDDIEFLAQEMQKSLFD